MNFVGYLYISFLEAHRVKLFRQSAV